MKSFFKNPQIRGFIVGCLAVLAVIWMARASTVFIGSMSSVNGTTNSPSIVYGSYVPQQPSFLVSDGGIPTTNALIVNWQISVDNTNFITLASFNPPVTAAGTYSWQPPLGSSNFFFRCQVVTTQAVQVGVIQTQ